MINIHRTAFGNKVYDPEICEFHGRYSVDPDELEYIERKTWDGKQTDFARPAKKGNWAFGGSFLHTSNGIFPKYNNPIPLHDWNLDLDKQNGD